MVHRTNYHYTKVIDLSMRVRVCTAGRSSEAIGPELKSFPFSTSLDWDATTASPMTRLAMAQAATKVS
jgi:hypothetical protein